MSVDVHYGLSGPQNAPVVALLSSLGTDMSMWDPQVPVLSRRFRVLRYDLRGHGKSPVPAGPYSIADLGGDLLGLLDRLEIESAHICGVSIGGMTGIWTAAHDPERVRRLVVCCSSVYLDPEGTYRERAKLVRDGGVEQIADAALARWFTTEWLMENPGAATSMWRRLVAIPREGYAGCCEALAEMDLRPKLDAVRAPTLVISGEDDPATPPAHGRAIANGIRGSRFETVAHAAHLASIEQSRRVTELIMGHLLQDEEEPR